MVKAAGRQEPAEAGVLLRREPASLCRGMSHPHVASRCSLCTRSRGRTSIPGASLLSGRRMLNKGCFSQWWHRRPFLPAAPWPGAGSLPSLGRVLRPGGRLPEQLPDAVGIRVRVRIRAVPSPAPAGLAVLHGDVADPCVLGQSASPPPPGSVNYLDGSVCPRAASGKPGPGCGIPGDAETRHNSS